MAGPKNVLSKAWEMLRKEITMDDPTPFGLFLGCKHTIHEKTIPGAPRPVRMMEYDVEGYLSKALDDYCSATGQERAKIKAKPTPFDGGSLGIDVNAPLSHGEWQECPWCKGRFDADCFGKGKSANVLKKTKPLLTDEAIAEADKQSEGGLLG